MILNKSVLAVNDMEKFLCALPEGVCAGSLERDIHAVPWRQMVVINTVFVNNIYPLLLHDNCGKN